MKNETTVLESDVRDSVTEREAGHASEGSSKRVLADLALGLCALIWGATFVLVKGALADVSPLLFLALRFGLAAVVMGIASRRSTAQLGLRSVGTAVGIGCFLFAGYVFQTVGLRFTTASKAAFIVGSSVVLVPILVGIFGRSRVPASIWAGAAAALSGLYFLTVPAAGLGALNPGDLIVFGCAVMFAFHILLVGHFAPRFSVGAFSFLQVLTTAGLAFLALPLSRRMGWERPHIIWTTRLGIALLISAVLSTAVAFSLQMWAQQNTSATHTAILLSLEPVFAVITARLLGREAIESRFLVGAVLILAGIFLSELKRTASTLNPDIE